MGKKVSVIIPVYNMESYLKQCLDSVCNQTLKDIEILCINDGSTDDSEKILKTYAEHDDRIILFNQKNTGVAAARNLGIEHAQGEYVIFMDPDDWYPESDILDVLYKKAKENAALICGGEFSDYNESTGEYGYDFPERYYGYKFDVEGFVEYREYQFDFGYQRFLFDRAMLIDNQLFFPPLIRFQDPPFFVKAMITAERFFAVKKVTYCYRYGHRGNIWNIEKIVALLTGLETNFELSIRYELENLRELTLYRLSVEYRDVIMEQVQSDEVLNKIKSIFNDTSLSKQKCILMQLGHELYLTQCELLREKQKILKSSKTFKLGHFLIYIPQRIYWTVRSARRRSK